MGNPNLFERYILWPLDSFLETRRLQVFNRVLKDNGMDWGKFPLEEITQMYHRHREEIIKF